MGSIKGSTTRSSRWFACRNPTSRFAVGPPENGSCASIRRYLRYKPRRRALARQSRLATRLWTAPDARGYSPYLLTQARSFRSGYSRVFLKQREGRPNLMASFVLQWNRWRSSIRPAELERLLAAFLDLCARDVPRLRVTRRGWVCGGKVLTIRDHSRMPRHASGALNTAQ
jgi:hypothetical protein